MTLWGWLDSEGFSAPCNVSWGRCHLGALLGCNVQDAYFHGWQSVLAVGWELSWYSVPESLVLLHVPCPWVLGSSQRGTSVPIGCVLGTYLVSACSLLAKIPLAKAIHMAKFRMWVRTVHGDEYWRFLLRFTTVTVDHSPELFWILSTKRQS